MLLTQVTLKNGHFGICWGLQIFLLNLKARRVRKSSICSYVFCEVNKSQSRILCSFSIHQSLRESGLPKKETKNQQKVFDFFLLDLSHPKLPGQKVEFFGLLTVTKFMVLLHLSSCLFFSSLLQCSHWVLAM